MKPAFSIQKLAYLLIVIVLLTYILFIGKNILAPLAFGVVFAFMLKPLCQKVEKYIRHQTTSIVITFVIALLPVVGLVSLTYLQFTEVIQNMDSITKTMQDGMDNLLQTVNSKFGISKTETEEIISDNKETIVQKPLSYLGATLSLSSNFLINFFLTIIYTFLLLLYRSSLKNFYLIQFGKNIQAEAEEVLERVQIVIQKYLYGLSLVIAILGVLNSIGLMIIGIQYAIFWGFLAAFLAIIPYVGTTLGGLMPFIYAMATTGNYWQPLAVILLFGTVQVIEGNLITPKVVGSSIKVNPLAAILALIVGGSIWGVAGLILSLPFVAIVRIIFQQVDILKPVGVLLGDEIYKKEDVFEEKFDKDKFRIFSFFKKKNPL